MPWVTEEESQAAKAMTAIEYLQKYQPDRSFVESNGMWKLE